jgi:hypothetical protein
VSGPDTRARDDDGGTGYTGLAFRQCHPDHASVAETIRLAAAFPSRFTPPGGRFGVLYVALAPETAVAELHRRAEQVGVPLSALAPRAMLTLTVRLRRVLDLTEPTVRTEWGLTRRPWAPTITPAARRSRWRPAPTATSDPLPLGRPSHPADAPAHDAADDNLAIFADRLHPGSDVRVVRHEPLVLDAV